MMVQQQGAKALAHLPRSGMFPSQAHAHEDFPRQLEPPRDGPHLPDQPHDAELLQVGSRLAQLLPRPQQDVVPTSSRLTRLEL